MLRDRSYEDATHFYGRVWGIVVVIALVLFPVVLCFAFSTLPDWASLGVGLLAILPMYTAVGFIEFITYVPMLGSAGSYLSFVTGSLTMLKVPAAKNAMQSAGVDANSEEGELISTIAIAVSSIVTTLIIALGVLLVAVTGFGEVLASQALAPAFDNILPALFGGLGVAFVAKDWKLAIVPIILAMLIFIVVPIFYPGLSGIGTVLVPVFGAISIASARIMYKKGWLSQKQNKSE